MHREMTFQGFNGITKFSNIMGISGIWKILGKGFSPEKKAEEVKDILKDIARRRNQIVHESDIVLKTSGKKITLNKIEKADVKKIINQTKEIVGIIDSIVKKKKF
jgi:hypothetical protein